MEDKKDVPVKPMTKVERRVSKMVLGQRTAQTLAIRPVNLSWLYAAIAGVLSLLPILSLFPRALCLPIPIFLGYLVYDFVRGWNEAWGFKTALRQYILVRMLRVIGVYQSWRYHRDSKNLRKAQEECLLECLAVNADTAYARDNNLTEVRNREDFKRIMPLTKYDHIQPYVERMMNGEEKQLTSQKPTYYGKTSGTTGQPAIIPFTPFLKKQLVGLVGLFSYNAERHVQWEELHRLRPVWKGSYSPKKILEDTPSGVKVGPMSSNPAWANVGEIFTVPTVCFEIEDAGSGAYVQLLFALRYRHLGAIEGIFASLVYSAFKKMEAEWPDLVNDIRHGTIRADPNIPSEVRRKLLSHLKPDPERADDLEREFKLGFDDIARRIWPELKIVNCISTGAFTIYGQYLRDHYIKDILIYPVMIGATEGVLGANFWPFVERTGFSLLPRATFYEFIPVEHSGETNPETVFADQLTLGQDYEMVITTAAGICRYRMGDVVRIIDHYNQCPILEFRHRAGAILCCKGERVTEHSIFACLNDAAQDLSSQLKRVLDYTSCESIYFDIINLDDGSHQKGAHYILFVELEVTSDDIDQFDLATKLEQGFDEYLQVNHYRYRELRDIKSLGHPVVYPMKRGCFQRMREFMLKTTKVSAVQLKIPRVIQKQALLQFLLEERLVPGNLEGTKENN